MNPAEENLRGLMRLFSGPEDSLVAALPRIMEGYGVGYSKTRSTINNRGRVRSLVFSNEESGFMFGGVYLIADLHDPGCPVLIELARSLSLLTPAPSVEYLLQNVDGPLEDIFPELCGGESLHYNLVIRLEPARDLPMGAGVLTVRGDDEDTYIPDVVLPRMRGQDLLPLYRGSAASPAPGSPRQIHLSLSEPYTVQNMYRLAQWLEEFLFVVDDSYIDYLFSDEEDAERLQPDLLELESGFFLEAFPERASEIMTETGTVSRSALEAALGRFFAGEADDPEPELWG